MRLIWSIVQRVDRRGHPREILEWGEAFLAVDDRSIRRPSAVRARALIATGFCAMLAGELERGSVLAEEAEIEFRALEQNDDEVHEATRLDNVALALYLRAHAGWFSGQPAVAEPLAREGITLARRAGASRTLSWVLAALGVLLIHQGRLAEAQTSVEEGLELAKAFDDGLCLPRIELVLAAIRSLQGDAVGASTWCREALGIGLEVADDLAVQFALDGLARVALLQGQFERAARILGAADERYEAMGTPGPCEPYLPTPAHAEFVARLREALGAQRFSLLTGEGRRLAVDDIVVDITADDLLAN